MPRLVVFYNGTDEATDRIFRLSDSFQTGENMVRSDVEVTVHMYNVRPQHGSRLLEGCKPLEEYEIRSFLKEHQTEVMNMCITEYNEAETMQMFKEEGREEYLISLICRKLRKGKSIEQIADELEEDEVRVKVICGIADEFAPDYDEEKVMQAAGVGTFARV